MICPNCDHVIPAGSRYCADCGAEQLPSTCLRAEFDRRMRDRCLLGDDARSYALAEAVGVLEAAAKAVVDGGHDLEQVGTLAGILVTEMLMDRLRGVKLRWYPPIFNLADRDGRGPGHGTTVTGGPDV